MTPPSTTAVSLRMTSPTNNARGEHQQPDQQACELATACLGCEAIDHRSCALEVFCVPNSLCVKRFDKFTEQVLDIAQASLSGLVLNLSA
jgi:hypothetical protein